MCQTRFVPVFGCFTVGFFLGGMQVFEWFLVVVQCASKSTVPVSKKYGLSLETSYTEYVSGQDFLPPITKVKLIWEPALNQEFTGFPAKISNF